MSRIALNGMQFHSFHGYYAEEQSVGNTYELDVMAESQIDLQALEDQLDNTINYEQIYLICKEEMATAQRLIETVAKKILARLETEIEHDAHYTIRIKKKHPLLGGLVDHALVEVKSQHAI
ncbi:MAG: dihydroneopterin aldolase [Saprospiraceae bacterium]|nr:dihydroneopterin aldolase [Saprospiraceae bacterium]